MDNVFQKIKINPFHAVIAFAEIGIGVFLIGHDDYFRWPPGAIAQVANDNVVGTLFLLTGMGIFYWILSNHHSVRLDHFLLIVSSFIMTVLTSYQFLHFLFAGFDMPWVSNLSLTVIIMILAYRSDAE